MIFCSRSIHVYLACDLEPTTMSRGLRLNTASPCALLDWPMQTKSWQLATPSKNRHHTSQGHFNSRHVLRASPSSLLDTEGLKEYRILFMYRHSYFPISDASRYLRNTLPIVPQQSKYPCFDPIKYDIQRLARLEPDLTPFSNIPFSVSRPIGPASSFLVTFAVHTLIPCFLQATISSCCTCCCGASPPIAWS